MRRARCRVVAMAGLILVPIALALGLGVANAFESQTRVVSANPPAASPPVGWFRRSVRAPKTPPGTKCPRTLGRPASEYSPQFGFAPALGSGPLFPVPDSIPPYSPTSDGYDGAIHFGTSRRQQGWYAVKVLWIAPPSYRGWTLIRGTRLDRRWLVRFSQGDDTVLAPHLWLRAAGNGDGDWQFWSSLVWLRAGGCYAIQIDGRTFSRTIIVKTSR